MALKATGLSAGYGTLPVIREINLELHPGRITGILGPNGAGKTTLLRALSGIIPIQSGRVTLDGAPLQSLNSRKRAQKIAWVQQREVAPFAFTVREWVEMGRFCHIGAVGRTRRGDRDSVERALKTCNLEHLADRSLPQLSGGEAQRAHIARALAQEAAMLFLDEPLTHLDLRFQAEVYRILIAEARRSDRALLCVIHDLTFAAAFCDELVCLKDGALFDQGTTSDVLEPDRLSQLYDTPIQKISSALVPQLDATTVPEGPL